MFSQIISLSSSMTHAKQRSLYPITCTYQVISDTDSTHPLFLSQPPHPPTHTHTLTHTHTHTYTPNCTQTFNTSLSTSRTCLLTHITFNFPLPLPSLFFCLSSLPSLPIFFCLYLSNYLSLSLSLAYLLNFK